MPIRLFQLLKAKKSQSEAGFTLIEFMIVTTLGVILMLAASSVFMTMLVSRAKTSTQQRIKSEGDYAMGQMEFLIRNAIKILPTSTDPNVTCSPTDLPELNIQSANGTITRFAAVVNATPPNQIGSITPTATNLLTSTNVNLVSGPFFKCNDSYFTITFTLEKNNLTQVFTSNVNMRNY